VLEQHVKGEQTGVLGVRIFYVESTLDPQVKFNKRDSDRMKLLVDKPARVTSPDTYTL
jgi:hypothetical protein